MLKFIIIGMHGEGARDAGRQIKKPDRREAPGFSRVKPRYSRDPVLILRFNLA